MKRLLIILIITLFGFGIWDFGFPVEAQTVYLGMYWIAGEVEDPDGKGTEGRTVIFYKDDPTLFSSDLVGKVGLSGRDNEFMINAYKNWALSVAPGKYYVAILQGSDGYGAAPVEVTLTGKGYDVTANLVLAFGAGPEKPLPIFEEIRFGKRLYQPLLVAKGQPFIVSDQPRVSAKIFSKVAIDTSKIFMVLNEGTATAKTYTIGTPHIVRATASEVDFVIDFLQEKETLPEGEQELTFKASNVHGTTKEVCTVMVAGGEPRLIGVPIVFPSPLHLKTDKQVIFQYTLSHDIDVELFMFDVSARVVKRMTLYAREEGGSAGVNKVTWNLITDQGSLVASGIYVFTLVNKQNGKLLGRGKFTALP